ncbi:MAG TPA: DMT family transporter [Ramlibacter sp.]|jgi:drug/metabolite transporter (DMT)-like permease|uniref:DMT family transporter n=1 Tax=Ramlibacter sp. TaxID=1917967 RepID=UPI002D6C19AE|nr:DMT family transporter [Ramlibacter sp.]HZY19735.1 DMT family transporter [Ramlibacter sp.]
MPVESKTGAWQRHSWVRRATLAQRKAGRLPASARGLLWSMAAGLLFVLLNAVMRRLSLQLDPFQTQFLRYLAGLGVMLPLVARSGWGAYRPRHIGGQFTRGAVHTAGLCLWFIAVPHITLADTTAIGFTGPIFIMIGAVLVFKEPMRWERWLAAGLGFGGVLIVVGPQLGSTGGYYPLVMLASSPVFAASFLITKGLTRYERPGVIVVWQAITVTAFSLPLALVHWQWPSAWQWVLFLLCGVLGSTGHYCLTRSFSIADISATQSVKFLDLVWAAALGWLVFGDLPSQWTLAGGAVICASTLWIARREARGRPPA